MDLPDGITPFTLTLPWETTVQGSPVHEVTFDFERVNYRIYGNVRIGEYQNIGPAASPTFTVTFALAGHRYSFDYEPDQFGIDRAEQLVRAIGRYVVNKKVLLAKPSGVPGPVGIEWGLSQDVVDYMESSGAIVPAPRGIFVAYRVFPASEYATATEVIPAYRGGVPPV